MARALTQERIDEIVKRYRPRGWRVRQSKHRWTWESAEADNIKRIIAVPTLIDDDSLFLYLHEIGHVTLGHFRHKFPKHREEFEAERFALHVFRSEGIPVTKIIMKGVRSRLCGWIDYDIKKGIAVGRHIARWAKHNGCS